MADAINRDGTIAVAWSADGIGRLSLDGEHWASVEWPEKRQQWCIEDVEGRVVSGTQRQFGARRNQRKKLWRSPKR
jgi:hypothetical protein